jgi:outer membrane receptor protein involved in Fe transport
LPVTADFKGSLTARYAFPIAAFDAYWQLAAAHNGDRWGDMDVESAKALGKLPSYTTVDFAAGFGKNDWMVDLFVSNVTGEDAPLYLTTECTVETCGAQPYGVRIKPTTISARFTMDFN